MNSLINKAIKKATGLDVKVHKSGGCCHFYSDDDAVQSKISSLYSSTVYVNSMNQLTTDQWVDEFVGMMAGLDEV